MIPIVILLTALIACAPTKSTDSASGVEGSGDTSAIDTASLCEEGIEIGQCAPDFTLPDATGADFTLSAQRGSVALVDISALW